MILLGLVLAGFGGMFFVRGSVGLAHWVRVSPALIGVTVAAFATSGPELAVGINAALAAKPEIALGDALGSNIFNSLLIVGLAAVICPITVKIQEVALALASGFLAVVLVLPSRRGLIGRGRGIFRLALYAAYLTTLFQFRP